MTAPILIVTFRPVVLARSMRHSTWSTLPAVTGTPPPIPGMTRLLILRIHRHLHLLHLRPLHPHLLYLRPLHPHLAARLSQSPPVRGSATSRYPAMDRCQ